MGNCLVLFLAGGCVGRGGNKGETIPTRGNSSPINTRGLGRDKDTQFLAKDESFASNERPLQSMRE
jgi:hypothetical protein